MIFNHTRWQIWAGSQHPYKHVLSEMAYSHPALPGGSVFNAQQAMDWIISVVYPQTKPAVATPGDLPLAGNTLGDYRIVNDNGNGKAAAYRWHQTEGMASPAWVQLYEMDWGVDSILEQATASAQALFPLKFGHDDVDGTDTPIGGTYAGQRFFGGATAGKNLTLTANNGDGSGAFTGYVQSDNTFRPTASGTLDLGTATLLWRDGYLSGHVYVGTMTLTAGSITDTSGTIDFGGNHLQTQGSLWLGGATRTLRLDTGSITDSSGQISFGSNKLVTTGEIDGGSGVFTGAVTADHVVATGAASTFKSGTTVGHLTLADGSITDSGGALSFGANTLTTTGNASFGQITGTKLTITQGGAFHNLSFDPTTGTFSSAGSLSIACSNLTIPTASGVDLTLSSYLQSPTINVGSTATQLLASSLNWTGTFTLSGTTLIHDVTTVRPKLDATSALGDSTHRYTSLFLSTGIGNGTNSLAIADLLSLRNINVGVADGDVLIYQSSSGTWVARTENTSIDHHLLMNLASGDDHTQYALLAGRAGGQTLVGGTLASQNLTLSSTAHATKGSVLVDSAILPTVTATDDLGSSSAKFRNLYLSGTAQLALATGGGSIVGTASQVGQLWYNTSTFDVWLDDGSGTNYLRKVSLDKFYYQDSTTWNGSATTVTYTVNRAGSGTTGRGWVSDARACIWSLKDNSNNFNQVLCDITATQTTVTVTVGMALAAGTYTLVGVG